MRSSSIPASLCEDSAGFFSSFSSSPKSSLIHWSDAISSPVFSSASTPSKDSGAIAFIQSGISAWSSAIASCTAGASESGSGLSKKEVGSASPSEIPQPAARMKSGISSSADVSIAESGSGSSASPSCLNQSDSSLSANPATAVPNPLENCETSPECQSNRSKLIAASATSSTLKIDSFTKAE